MGALKRGAVTDGCGSPSPGNKGNKVSFVFQPGKTGLKLDPDSGRVSAVGEGGQAAQMGVKVGWRIAMLNESNYSCDLLKQVVSSGEPYTVLFLTQAPTRVAGQASALE